MSRDLEQDQSTLEDVEQLLEYFRAGVKTRDQRGVGTEHEKFLFRAPDYRVVPFDGPGGIEEILERLAERFGWERSYDHDRLVALTRNDEAITLEPGGQFELSGGVKRTIFETREEFDRHIQELRDVTSPDYASVSWGLNPFDGLEDVSWVPKARYGVMRSYLSTRGDLAHWMMKGTCTIQANLDYTGEEDAVDIIRTAVLVSPIVNAVFANSPLREGEDTGMQSYRAHIWTRTDPDRTGVPSFMYGKDWGFRDYLEYALDVPMFFIRREGQYVDMSGHSFRDFMAEGHEGFQPTLGDFELHMSTLFPEVRLKKFIEVRSADGGPREHVLALPAFWKGILYHEPSRQQAADYLWDLCGGERHRELFEAAAQDGLRTAVSGHPMAEVAAHLLDLSATGLDALAEEHEPSESIFLESLRYIVQNGHTLADELAADFQAAHGNRVEIIRKHDLFRQ